MMIDFKIIEKIFIIITIKLLIHYIFLKYDCKFI